MSPIKTETALLVTWPYCLWSLVWNRSLLLKQISTVKESCLCQNWLFSKQSMLIIIALTLNEESLNVLLLSIQNDSVTRLLISTLILWFPILTTAITSMYHVTTVLRESGYYLIFFPGYSLLLIIAMYLQALSSCISKAQRFAELSQPQVWNFKHHRSKSNFIVISFFGKYLCLH